MKPLLELATRTYVKDGEKLNEVETDCLLSLDCGKPADFGKGKRFSLDEVASRGSDRSIRSTLLSWLCTDPIAARRLKSTGLSMRGHRIEGDLKLAQIEIPFRISLLQCVLPYPVDLRKSSLPALDLSGSRTVRIDADEVTVAEDVRLADGFSAKGPVSFIAAAIDGDFVSVHGHFNNHSDHHRTTRTTGCQDCRGSKLHAYSLIVERAKVAGSMFLCGDFTADGGVLIADTEIGSNLNCTNGIFSARVYEATAAAKGKGRRLSCEADADDHLACAFNAEGARVKGNMMLNKVTVRGEARLTGAWVGGDLESVTGVFRNHGANALHGDRLKVMGNVFFSERFEAEGKVRFPMAEVGRDLSLTGALLTNPGNEEVLFCKGMSVAGSIYLNEACVTAGYIDLCGVNVGGNLDCTDASFVSNGKVALSAEGMKVTRSIFLSSDRSTFQAVGAVQLSGSDVGMDLNCHNGQFTSNASGVAILASTMNIHGRVLLTGSGFRAAGHVCLAHTKIDSYLSFSGGTFLRPADNHAISAINVQVGGSIFLTDSFSATGGIRLNGASIGRDLVCNGGSIKSESEPALWAVQMKVTGSVEMENLISEGEIRINNSSIGGNLICSHASFVNLWGNTEGREVPEAGQKRYALQANGVSIKGCAAFDGFHADGIVSFQNSEIGMHFVWKGVTESKKALLNLCSLKAGVLEDEESSWPGRLEMDYFEYRFLAEAEMSADSLKSRREKWLALPRHFISQPYEHLAEVLKRSGYDEEAKKVFIEKNRRQRRLPVRWKRSARDKKRQTQTPQRWLYLSLYDLLISYGYRPMKAFLIGCLLIGLGTWWFHLGFKKDVMAPVKPREESHLHQLAPIGTDRDLLYVKESKTHFYSFVYAVDTFLPLIDLQTADYWLPLAYPAKNEQKAEAIAPKTKEQPDRVPGNAKPAAGSEADTQQPELKLPAGTQGGGEGKGNQTKEVADKGKATVGEEFSLLGGFLCWYRWFLIGIGWVISTLLAASLGGIVRK